MRRACTVQICVFISVVSAISDVWQIGGAIWFPVPDSPAAGSQSSPSSCSDTSRLPLCSSPASVSSSPRPPPSAREKETFHRTDQNDTPFSPLTYQNDPYIWNKYIWDILSNAMWIQTSNSPKYHLAQMIFHATSYLREKLNLFGRLHSHNWTALRLKLLPTCL